MEEIREIPEGWEVDSISKLCDIVDYRGKTPEKVDMGTFLVTAKNIRNGKIDYNISQEYVKTEKYEEIMSRGLPKIGDVLITTEAPLGEVASIDNESIALAQRIIKLRGKKEKLKNEYLKYYMLGKEFQKEIKNDATGSTVEGIKGSRLKNQVIKFPKCRDEQQKIAQILSTLDQNIEKTEQTIEKYKKIKSGLMDDLLTGKIRIKDGKWVKETEFKEVEGVGRIPKDWEVKELDKISSYIGRGTSPEYVEKSNYKIINQACIYWDGIKLNKVKYVNSKFFENLSDNKKVEKGAILINSTGTGTLGRVVYYDFEEVITYDSHVTKLKIKDACPKYYSYYFSSVKFQLEIDNFCVTGSTNQIELQKSELENRVVPVFHINEQKAIANILSKQDELIQKEQQYLEKLKKLKAGLMEDLLTGKVRVKIK